MDKSDELARLALNPKEVLEQIPKSKRKAALKEVFPLLVQMSEILQKYRDEEKYDKQIPKQKIVSSDPESTDDTIE